MWKSFIYRGNGQSLDQTDQIYQNSIQEAIGLELEQVKILKGCFDGFADEDGAIPADNVGGILSMMGMKFKPSALREIIEEIDEDGEQLICLKVLEIR